MPELKEQRSVANGETYDRTTIGLHWTTAILVVLLWIIGQTADWIPNGPVNTDYWSVHVVLGFAVAVVIAWRMIWRRSGDGSCPPPTLARSTFWRKRRTTVSISCC
jgi:cytochrome b561